MKQLVYIGPDLIFNFLQRVDNPKGNYYQAIVKAKDVKLVVTVQFEQTQASYQDKKGPVQCSMGMAIGSVAGDAVSLDKMNAALDILTRNSKTAAEVCCQAFLNGFLDGGF